jgi:prevent-host-death family protein
LQRRYKANKNLGKTKNYFVIDYNKDYIMVNIYRSKMKFSESIKPISYLKAHASEVIRDVVKNQKTLVITHNGKAKVVLQDVKLYEKTQEGIALLKILALSGKEIKSGKSKPLHISLKNVQKKINEFKWEQSEVQS